MRRWLLVLAGLVLVGVAAFLVAVPVAIQRNLSAEAVARRASELAGRAVSVEAVRLAFRPALRIRAEGVSVEGAGTAEAVEVAVAVRPLLRRRVEPAAVHLLGARLHVERSPAGLRVRLLHRPGAEDAQAGGVPALPALRARDAELVPVGPDGRRLDAPVLRIRRLALGALSGDAPAPLRVDLAVAPGGDARWSLGEARLEAELAADGGAVRLGSGRVAGRELVARGLRAGRFEGRFAFADGAVDVTSLALSGYGGTVEVAGRLVLAEGVRFAGRVDAAGLDLGALVADWRGRPLAHPPGTLAARGDLARLERGPLRGDGRGTLALRDGRLPAGSLFEALLGTLGRLTDRLLPVGDAFAPAPSRLASLTASWTLEGDRLRSDDLEVVTDDYRYRARGHLGLDRTLAFEGTLQLTSRGAQRLLASAALPLPAATSVMPEIPVRVAGDLGDPSVAASAGALPAAARDSLADLVGGASGVVKDAARTGKKVLDGVLGR